MKKKRKAGRPKGVKNKKKEEVIIVKKIITKTEKLKKLNFELVELERSRKTKNAGYDFVVKLIMKSEKRSLDHFLLLEIIKMIEPYIIKLNTEIFAKESEITSLKAVMKHS